MRKCKKPTSNPTTALRQTCLSDGSLLRLWSIIGDPKRGIAPIIPVCKTAWYAGMQKGIYPAPVKRGRSVMWKSSDIKSLAERMMEGEA